MGFWVWSWGKERLDARLRTPLKPTRIALKKGWNQIGSPFDYPVSLDDIAVIKGSQQEGLGSAHSKGWIGKYLFLYDTDIGEYQGLPLTGGVLEPWKGYWIRAYEDCELLIPNTLASPSATKVLVDKGKLLQEGIELPPVAPPPLREGK